MKIIFAEQNPAKRLTDLTVIDGGEKYSWSAMQAGETKSVNLKPDPQSLRQLTFFYRIDGEQKIWEGPKFDMGVGYRIELKINGLGAVAERHCVLPCELD